MMIKYETLLSLKEDHNDLGLKGTIYFISDLPRNIATKKTNLIISTPTFKGLGVGSGICTFVLTKEQVDELFEVLDKTFDEYAEELQRGFYEEMN